MDQEDRDRKAYSLAKSFILQFKDEGVTPEILEKYLHFSEVNPRPKSLPELYYRLLLSAKNANMRSSVIDGGIGDIANLAAILCDFDPPSVIEKYGTNWENILYDIEQRVNPGIEIRRAPKSIWPRYCKTMISGAEFLSKFNTADEFYSWVESFDRDGGKRLDGPKQLSKEIYGFGFALSCDFLKEIGYIDFAKPDVHVMEIFKGLELCPEDANEYEVFEAVERVAMNAGVTTYSADKLFWLIGSGYFYDDPQIGNNGRIGRHKKEFITFASAQLSPDPQYHSSDDDIKTISSKSSHLSVADGIQVVYVGLVPIYCPACGSPTGFNDLNNPWTKKFRSHQALLCPSCGLRSKLAE